MFERVPSANPQKKYITLYATTENTKTKVEASSARAHGNYFPTYPFGQSRANPSVFGNQGLSSCVNNTRTLLEDTRARNPRRHVAKYPVTFSPCT